MRFDTVFLDMGETLVHPRPSYVDLYQEGYRRAGLDVDPEALAEAVEAVWTQVSERDATAAYEATEEANRRFLWEVESEIFDRLGLQHGRDGVFKELTRLFNDPASYDVFPDVRPALAELKRRGYRLGIVSNWNWHLSWLCHDLGLASAFDLIVVSARVGFAKPHPRIFETALELAGSSPERTAHVGDNPHADVKGAQGVGITGVLLDRYDRFSVDGYLKIRSLEELPDLLSRP